MLKERVEQTKLWIIFTHWNLEIAYMEEYVKSNQGEKENVKQEGP